MKNNIVFMISDASFKPNREAILAVKDSLKDHIYQKVVRIKIQNSLRAEELALKYAIDLAIMEGYKHVVFVYDCLAIQTEKFIKRYSHNFETMQMLWIKRKHISEIDRLTKEEETEEMINIKQIPELERDNMVFNIMSKYVETELEKQVFSKVCKKKDFRVVRENRTALFCLTYYLLSNNSKKMFKRILKEHLNPLELKKTFKKKHKREYHGLYKQLNIKEDLIYNLLKLKQRSKL